MAMARQIFYISTEQKNLGYNTVVITSAQKKTKYFFDYLKQILQQHNFVLTIIK